MGSCGEVNLNKIAFHYGLDWLFMVATHGFVSINENGLVFSVNMTTK